MGNVEWEIKTLLDLSVSIEDGDWIEKKDQSTSGIRLIQTGNVGQGCYKDKGEKAKYISEDTFIRLRCTELTTGDILVSRLPEPVGRACILPALGVRCITAVDCSIIKLKQDIIYPQWFVYYSLSSEYAAKVKKECSGTTRDRISRKKLSCITVPVPPLSEQQRIVDILDAEFAKIDALKENAEKNLQNAKDLFCKCLKREFEGQGTTLGSVLNLRRGHDLTHNEMVKGDIPVAGSGGIIGFHNSSTPISPCITVGRSGSVGKVFIYETCWAHNTVLYVDDFKGNNPFYLTYLLMSMDLSKKQSGCGVPTLNRNYLHPMIIGFNHNVYEQAEIVANLNNLHKNSLALESNYEKIISLCGDLKQALLRKAFNGEL